MKDSVQSTRLRKIADSRNIRTAFLGTRSERFRCLCAAARTTCASPRGGVCSHGADVETTGQAPTKKQDLLHCDAPTGVTYSHAAAIPPPDTGTSLPAPLLWPWRRKLCCAGRPPPAVRATENTAAAPRTAAARCLSVAGVH